MVGPAVAPLGALAFQKRPIDLSGNRCDVPSFDDAAIRVPAQPPPLGGAFGRCLRLQSLRERRALGSEALFDSASSAVGTGSRRTRAQRYAQR